MLDKSVIFIFQCGGSRIYINQYMLAQLGVGFRGGICINGSRGVTMLGVDSG